MRTPALAVALALAAGSAAPADALRPDVRVVSTLYQDFAGEVVLDDPAQRRTLVEQPLAVLTRYFTPEVADWILRERTCVAHAHQACHLDFLLLWGSQDATGATVRIAPEAHAGHVAVTISTPDGEKRALNFCLVQTHGAWRIDDIRYPGSRPPLSQILEGRAGCE